MWPMTAVEVFAPAKINLALHVTGRRRDGYHLLDSLVAFADVGDRLFIQPAQTLSLVVEGPEAAGVPSDATNLVLKAAGMLARRSGASIRLEKHLPAAAGIGGGSADAAAAIRGLSALDGQALPSDISHVALKLGADVPMCMTPEPMRVGGVGERLEPVDLPPIAAVLVNPRVPVSTAGVFAALGHRDNPPMPSGPPALADAAAAIAWLAGTRNDLETPALTLVPEIADVLAALRAMPGCGLARMSGSGATCFGLFDGYAGAKTSAGRLVAQRPDWWVMATVLGGQGAAAQPVLS